MVLKLSRALLSATVSELVVRLSGRVVDLLILDAFELRLVPIPLGRRLVD